MKANSNLYQWADAHVFYNMFTHSTGDNSQKFLVDEFRWRQKALHETPNGDLLIKNSFFDDLGGGGKIYLAHTTPNLSKILNSNNLHPSGGCLVGSIYCTHLIKEGDRLRMHNLGRYVFNEEAPRLLSHDKLESLGALIIEIDPPETAKENLIGIDYLRLGKIHFNIYKELEYLLSSDERYKLEDIVVSKTKCALEYLNLCTRAYYFGQKVDPKIFLGLFVSMIEYLPILGYLYFEAISEYIMLYQDNNQSLDYKKLGEFYSPSYKNLIPDQSGLPVKFSLRQFRPTLNDLLSYLNKKSVFSRLDSKHLSSYLTERLIFLTNARLLSEEARIVNWNEFMWSFDNLSKYAKPLIGHLIHRELRSFGRYPYFYFYFDQYKALQIWNYWNHMDIAIPFNGVIPKGEIGINPAYTDLRYRVYTSKVRHEKEHTYLEPEKQVQVDIAPMLVNLKLTFMRSDDNRQN